MNINNYIKSTNCFIDLLNSFNRSVCSNSLLLSLNLSLGIGQSKQSFASMTLVAKELNPWFVTGFIDAEGTFAISVIKRS
jgi:hypothetical protein